MSSSSLAARLRKILPFIGRNTASADRECYLRAFRRLYSEDPMAFSEVFDDELEKLRSEYPREITELIEQAGYAELDDQIVAAEREDGSVTTLYAAGFLAYGLENQALAAENLKLRQISFNEGLSTALDVREARTQLIGAQIAQRAAAFKFVVAWVRLHAASGVMPEFMQTLTRADLVPVK